MTQIISELLEKKATLNDKGQLQINCKDAILIAEELQIEIIEVAKRIHDKNIKITKCQLGCF